MKSHLEKSDKDIWNAVSKEQTRQEEHIELIASENYTSKEVMLAQGSELTNKYAEGYPHKRYYGGCEHVDTVEALAIERAKTLFDAGYANVQPHSGSQANAAVYMALLKPGDTILGLSLDHGGHLTHGAKPNFSGKIYKLRINGTLFSQAELTLYAHGLPRSAKDHLSNSLAFGPDGMLYLSQGANSAMGQRQDYYLNGL